MGTGIGTQAGVQGDPVWSQDGKPRGREGLGPRPHEPHIRLRQAPWRRSRGEDWGPGGTSPAQGPPGSPVSAPPAIHPSRAFPSKARGRRGSFPAKAPPRPERPGADPPFPEAPCGSQGRPGIRPSGMSLCPRASLSPSVSWVNGLHLPGLLRTNPVQREVLKAGPVFIYSRPT